LNIYYQTHELLLFRYKSMMYSF